MNRNIACERECVCVCIFLYVGVFACSMFVSSVGNVIFIFLTNCLSISLPVSERVVPLLP